MDLDMVTGLSTLGIAAMAALDCAARPSMERNAASSPYRQGTKGSEQGAGNGWENHYKLRCLFSRKPDMRKSFGFFAMQHFQVSQTPDTSRPIVVKNSTGYHEANRRLSQEIQREKGFTSVVMVPSLYQKHSISTRSDFMVILKAAWPSWGRGDMCRPVVPEERQIPCAPSCQCHGRPGGPRACWWVMTCFALMAPGHAAFAHSGLLIRAAGVL